MGCVYQLTSPSGKSYIGVTTKSFQTRFSQHKKLARYKKSTPIHRAIRKYGEDKIAINILFESDDSEILKLLECEFIEAHDTLAPKGYNCTLGGDGVFGFQFTEESILKISESLKRNWNDPEYRRKQTLNAQEKWNDPSFVEKHKAAMISLFATSEHSKKLSERTKRNWENGVYKNKLENASMAARGINSKLTNDQVSEIKKLKASGIRNKDIATLFRISASHVSSICTGKRRGYVQCPI